MNKLDLIFEKEPPDVQRKLMNLLIQYNAIMHYNKDDDKFQVDLLLPFQTTQEKQQFINNFKSRSNKKIDCSLPYHREQLKDVNTRMKSQSEHNILTYQKNHKNMDSLSDIAQQHPHLNELQMKRMFLNESCFNDHQINLKDISAVIQNKIKQAVQQIVNENTKGNRCSIQSQNGRSKQSDHHEEKNTILKKVKIRQSDAGSQVQAQMSIPSSTKPGKFKSQPNVSIPQNIRIKSQNIERSNRSSEVQYQIKDEENQQSEQSNKKQPSQHENQNTHSTGTFINAKNVHESDDRNLETQFINDDQQNNEVDSYKAVTHGKRTATFSEKPKQRKISEGLQKTKEKFQHKRKDKKQYQYNTNGIRQRYMQFMKQSHREFEKIYENIQKDIRRNDRQLKKSRENHPILVLQQNLIDIHAQSEEDRLFKEEMIKDYQKHIVAQNKCLSSEDLVRYFKYLLQHANTLYIKHLRKAK